MTIYIHFSGGTLAPKKLHNVARVEDGGPFTVIVVNQYGGGSQRFGGVHHVALEPERDTEAGR